MPLLKLHKIQDHTLVGVWYVTESLGELEAHPALFSYIEESYQFKSSKRRREWLVVRLLLNELLGSSASISYHPSGRPFLVDSMYSISVSHTDSYVALIVSKKAKVSIDIEYISTRINRITRRFLRSDESFALAENKLLSNLLIWCSKELLFKLIDQSNIDFKKHLRVLPFRPVSPVGVFYGMQKVVATRYPKYIPIHYQLSDNYVMVYTFLD